jgi:hypothetical protein
LLKKPQRGFIFVLIHSTMESSEVPGVKMALMPES